MADGYFAIAEDGERFYRELTWLCLHQHGAFNSPVWFNVGLYHISTASTGAKCNWHWNPETMDVEQPENPYEYPQGSACFIQSVEDNMEDIMGLATQRGHALQVRLAAPAPTCRRSARTAKSSPAAASPAARCRSCGSTTRSRRW